MKRIFKDRSTGKICGVCSGVAQYFEVDVTLIRIIWAACFLLGGSGFLLYLLCAILLPDKSTIGY